MITFLCEEELETSFTLVCPQNHFNISHLKRKNGIHNDETESMQLKNTHTQIKERKKQSILERREKVKSEALTDKD